MSRRRDEMLKEMGLWPVWRLRGTAATEAVETTQEKQVSTQSGSSGTLPATPDQSRPTSHASSVTPREARFIGHAPRGTPLPPRVSRHAVPVTGNDERRERIMQMDWDALKGCVATCVDCALHAKRNKTVFGVGDERASWLFVGEGPGADEDVQGEPFVGQAGKLLDSMLAAIKLRRGHDAYIANVVKCLRYNALVQLGNRSWERIGRLVAARYSGDVMSIDASGALVPRRVIGWHASPLAARRVFRLSYASAKSAGASKSGIQLTGDHPVLTGRGWIAVQELIKGDTIATGQGLSEVAFDVVCGTLLGDGHIATHNAHLSISHTERQSEYLRLKAELLAELDCHVETLVVSARVGGARQYPIIRMRTRAHRALSVIRAQFYGTKKHVPAWIETGLNNRMLAFWFMDDGYVRIRDGRQPRAEIATCAFSENDIQRLLLGLANLGIFAKALRGRLHFDVQQTRRLSEKIAPFVPPSMRYKLHPEVAPAVPFDPVLLKAGSARVLYDDVDVEEIIHRGSDQTFFCLDVEETHNFVTSGGVVHNCRPPGNRNPQPEEALACEPYLHRQIELIQPGLIVALGKVAAVNLLAREATIASLRGRVHQYRGIPLIVTYHPAYLLRNLPDKAKAWADLCFAVETMRGLKERAGATI